MKSKEEYRAELEQEFSKCTKEELVENYNIQICNKHMSAHRMTYKKAIREALVKSGLNCAVIYNQSTSKYGDEVRVVGNKLVLKWQYVETIPIPQNRSSEYPFNSSIIKISEKLERHRDMAAYRFKVFNSHKVSHLFMGANRFDIVTAEEFDKDEDSRIPVLWASKVRRDYDFDQFTDNEERLVAVFIPNYHLDDKEHRFFIFKAIGSKAAKKLYEIKV